MPEELPTPEWRRLMTASKEQAGLAVMEYSQHFIDQHLEGELREEEVGSAICGIVGAGLEGIPEDIGQLIDSACQLEIGRDTKYFFGEGTWSEEEADAKKELQYEAFLTLFESLKDTYI